ncbi:hypothetical protein ACTMU2_11770 [Cupriavidus basilensis]
MELRKDVVTLLAPFTVDDVKGCLRPTEAGAAVPRLPGHPGTGSRWACRVGRGARQLGAAPSRRAEVGGHQSADGDGGRRRRGSGGRRGGTARSLEMEPAYLWNATAAWPSSR